MVRLVLFDIDGTLIHTGGAGVKAFGLTFEEEFGLKEGMDRIKFGGRTDYSLVREFFNLHRIAPSPAHFEQFFAGYYRRLERLLRECKGGVCPGILEFFTAARALPEPPMIGLLTGNVKHGAEIKLRHYDLWNYFPFGAFADDSENRDEIAAAAHRRGNERMGRPLAGEEIVVVGDTPLDIKCARSIGAKVLAVATGASPLEELARHKPDWAVPDISRLTAAEVCR